MKADSVAYCASHSVPVTPPWMTALIQRSSLDHHDNVIHSNTLNLPSRNMQELTVAVLGSAGRCALAMHLAQSAIHRGAKQVILVLESDAHESGLPLEVGFCQSHACAPGLQPILLLNWDLYRLSHQRTFAGTGW